MENCFKMFFLISEINIIANWFVSKKDGMWSSSIVHKIDIIYTITGDLIFLEKLFTVSYLRHRHIAFIQALASYAGGAY
jgi:hypothetical protein